ncbi:hypothetical protein ABK040_007863 [Willaertia magna]
MNSKKHNLPLYNKSQKQSIRLWMEQVLGESFKTPTDLHASLKDGVLLVKLICKLKGMQPLEYLDSISLETKNNNMLEMKNIAFFIKECQKLENVSMVWPLTALHKNLDMNAVCHTIVTLSEYFEKNKSEFKGPFLTFGTNIKSKLIEVTKTSSVIDELQESSVEFLLKRLRIEYERKETRYIPALASLLRMKGEDFCKSFGNEGGVLLIGKIIQKFNYVYKTIKDKFIQGNYVHCLLSLIENDVYDPFINHFQVVNDLVLLLNKKENLMVRYDVLDIFSYLCNYSEEGFWIVLNAFTMYAQVNNQNRFYDLIDSLQNQRDEMFKGKVLFLINSMVNAPYHVFARNHLKREFKALNCSTIVSEIQKKLVNAEDFLKEKIKEFHEQTEKEELDTSILNNIEEDELIVTTLKRLYLDLALKSSDHRGGIYYLLESISKLKEKKRNSGSSYPSTPTISTSLSTRSLLSSPTTSTTSGTPTMSSPTFNNSSSGNNNQQLIAENSKLQTEIKMIQKLVRSQKVKLDKLKEQVQKQESMSSAKFLITEEEAGKMNDLEISRAKSQLLKSLRVLKEREQQSKEQSKNYSLYTNQ